MEWTDEYADPGHEASIAEMDAIASKVIFFLPRFGFLNGNQH